jgi:hypothetical protein
MTRPAVSRRRRGEIEQAARLIRRRLQAQGRQPYEIVAAITAELTEVFELEAWRFAFGWNRQEVSKGLDDLYEADRLAPPQISSAEICKWEHRDRRPSDERIDYLCRLYRTRPDRLGFGSDYGPTGSPTEQPPALANGDGAPVASAEPVRGVPDLVAVYPHRGALPQHRWAALLDNAHEQIDILVYAGLFLPDGHPDLAGVLSSKANHGAKIRLAFGDPGCDAVRLRGDEEGISSGLGARIRLSLTYLRDAFGVPGIEIRTHQATLYNSLYRFDDDLLVNAHAYGAPAAHSPLLHLRQAPGGRLFAHYQSSFERVWSQAALIGDPSQKGAR